MALEAERVEAIGVAIGELMKHGFALPNVKALTLQIIDDGIPDFAKRPVRVFLRLGGSDHLPKQNARQIVPSGSTPCLGLLTDPLLTDDLFCVALFSRFPGHDVLFVGGALSWPPAMQATNADD